MPETQPKYDGVLLHVYGYKEQITRPGKKPSPLRPALRSRLVIAAAKELFDYGLVENFVLSGGPMLGETMPVSALTAIELVRRTNISTYVSVNFDAPVTTSQELNFLREKADQNHWSNLLCIGWELHRDNVEILILKKFKRTNMQVTFKSAQEILATYPAPKNQEIYRRVIDAVENSPGEAKWAEYERKKNRIIRLPFGAELLDLLARVYRPKAD